MSIQHRMNRLLKENDMPYLRGLAASFKFSKELKQAVRERRTPVTAVLAKVGRIDEMPEDERLELFARLFGRQCFFGELKRAGVMSSEQQSELQRLRPVVQTLLDSFGQSADTWMRRVKTYYDSTHHLEDEQYAESLAG